MREQERLLIRQALTKHSTVLIKCSAVLAVTQIYKVLTEQYNLSEAEAALFKTESHPDILTFDAREINTAETREIRSLVSTSPARLQYRYLLLANFDRLHFTAAQTLLKLIEEPPSTLKTVLISDRPKVLPLTIKSRAVQISLRTPVPEEVEAILQEKGTPEAAWRAQACAGDIQTAIELDVEVTREWDKIWAISTAGTPIPPDFSFSWYNRLKEQNEATLVAVWNLLSERAANMLYRRSRWGTIAYIAIEERERNMAGRSNKLILGNALVKVYNLAKQINKK